MTSPQHEIDRFDGECGPESAATAPASWYTRPEFHALDSRVLKSHWQPVGGLGMLQGPGSYFSGSFLGEPYVVVQGEDGKPRAFFNVCRHHATGVATGSGKCKELVCPYHGWTYGLDGGLKRAPQIAGVKDFNKSEMGLVPVPLKLFGPLILLNFSRQDNALPADWLELETKLDGTGWGGLRFVKRETYEIGCNWKVYLDNYLDGGYHVAHLHKGLAGMLSLENYKIENFANHTIQSCGGASGAKKKRGDFSERIGSGALYAWLHPNWVINRYGDILDTNWIVPLAPDRCLTVFDYYFAPEKARNRKFVASSLKASRKVQDEDIAICESVQRGLASSAYDVGRYAPKLESGAYLFHRLLQRDLRRALR